MAAPRPILSFNITSMTRTLRGKRSTLGSLISVTLFACSTTGLLAGPSGSGGGHIGSMESIADREIARRLAMAEDAMAAVERGDALRAAEKFDEAIAEYKVAIDLLPEAPRTADRRQVALDRYVEVSVDFARQQADRGRKDEALRWVSAVLDRRPDHARAQKLLSELSDPAIYPPAMTAQHFDNVEAVNKGLQLGISYYDLGQFDKAREALTDVLRVDRYNTAARRMLEKVDREIIVYAKDARRQTRAKMLQEVDQQWETVVPASGVGDTLREAGLGAVDPDETAYVSQKLNSIILPQVQFDDTTVEEAISFLAQRSRELDTMESDPAERGVNIVLKNTSEEGAEPPRISLDLQQVPLATALRYITDLAGLKYKVEPYAVVVVPITDVTDDLYTRVFRVPPDFVSGAGGAGGGAAAEVDPFAAPADAGGGGGIAARKTAREVLEERGVTFPDGSSAFFNPTTSKLVVRNTQTNIDLIDAYVRNLINQVSRQIHITTKFLEVTQDNLDELGFDWLMGPFNIGGERLFGNGGVAGNSGGFEPGDFPINNPNLGPDGNPTAIGGNPLTRGLRFGRDAIANDSLDGLLASEAAIEDGTQLSPGIFGLSGVFSDPQFQVLVRSLSQRKGADLMTAPSIVTRTGQRAKIEVIREFIYPIEFDPPEIPERIGSSTLDVPENPIVGEPGQGQVNSFPVTPTTPTAFETRNVGVTVEVDPVIGNDGYTIDLNLAPEVVEFEGFVNYGSPIETTAVNAAGQLVSVELTANRIEQPIFATRRVTTAVTIWDGQTVAIGGLMREDVQTVEDKVPVLGDLPLIGRLFQTKADQHFKRNLMVFVTARLIDPSGQPIRSHEELIGNATADLEVPQ